MQKLKIPKNEKVLEVFNDIRNDIRYCVTRGNDERYRLYQKTDEGYTFLKSKQDALFPETHPVKKRCSVEHQV